MEAVRKITPGGKNVATYKKKDNNEKNKASSAAEEDFFSVSSFAEFLKSTDSKTPGSVNLKSDDETVIEPFDEDTQSAEKSQTAEKPKTSKKPPVAEKPQTEEKAQPSKESKTTEKPQTAKKPKSGEQPQTGGVKSAGGTAAAPTADKKDGVDSQVSGDDFLKQLYSETQSGITSELDALKNDCRLFIPDTEAERVSAPQNAADLSGEPKTAAPEKHSAPAKKTVGASKAASFSEAVKNAMDAEGEYGGFDISLDALDALDGKPDFTAVGGAGAFGGVGSAANAKKQLAERSVKSSGANGKSQSKKKKKKKGFFAGLLPGRQDGPLEIFRKSMFLVSIVTMLICGGILSNTYLIQPYVAKIKADELSGLRGDAVKSWDEVTQKYSGITFPSDMRVNLADFYAINSDFYGYLEIDGKDISMPVVRGRDNDYYRKRNFRKEWTKYGCPFTDYRNSMGGLDRNTIIYGHNMEYDDLIFGPLERYRKIEGFKKSPIIKLETLYDEYVFKVYAVYVSNGKVDSTGWIFNYIFTELISDNEFGEYISQVDQRKLYSTGVDIKNTDKILTLSTCAYDFPNARLVIIGRLVRDGESTKVDTSKAFANPSPRYPAEYYSKKGVKNPYAGSSKWIPNA